MRRKKRWILLVIAIMLPPIGCCGIPTYACYVEGDVITKVPLQPIDQFMGKDDYSLDDIMQKAEDRVDDEILPLTADAEFTYMRLSLDCVDRKCEVTTMEAKVEVFSRCIPLLLPNYHRPDYPNSTWFTFDFEDDVVEADTTALDRSFVDAYGSAKQFPSTLERIVRIAVNALQQNHIDLRNAEFYINVYAESVSIKPEFWTSDWQEISIDPTTGNVRVLKQDE